MSNSLNNPLTKELITTESITKELTTIESIKKELKTESIKKELTKELPVIDFYNDYDISFPYLTYKNDQKDKKDKKDKKDNNKINEKKSIITDSYIKTIKLNTTNVLTLKGIIDEKNTNIFLYDFNLNTNKNNLYIFIDSVGGSVEEGYKIINEILKYDVNCIAEKAYSMAFAILQACKTRYLLPFGKLMQHQISFGISNEKEKIVNYLDFVNQMEKKLLLLQSSKLNISISEFKNKTLNEWWLFSDNSLHENCIDEIVNVECSSHLTRDSYTVNMGMYDYTYSKCPLIPNYIDKKTSNDNNKDFIYFI